MSEYELMVKVKELMDSGKTAAELVREIRHDAAWINKSYSIMTKLPKEALEYFKVGKISRPAMEALACVHEDKIEAVWTNAVKIFESK